MMKKWTIVLIILLASVCACACAWAESPATDFEYSIAGGEVTITRYIGHDADVVVPSTIEGLPVTVIGERAIANSNIRHLTLPTTVKKLEAYALWGVNAYVCTLETLTFEQPGSLTTIGEYALAGQAKLREVILPSTVTDIGAFAFADCEGLEACILPEGLLTIGNSAFEDCKSLKSIKLPESLQSLGEFAFSGADVSDINIPKNITELPPYCFYGCTFETFTFPAHVTSIGQCALAYSGLKSIVIPDTVTEFGAYLFAGCASLTDVTLPANMTTLPMCAFAWCTSLESLVLPDSIWAFETACFSGCTNLKELNLPANLQSVTSCAFDDSLILTQSVDRVVSEVVKPGMSDFEKALALHDWLIYNADYDTNCNFHSAAGVLFFGRGVCQSYADAYALLLSAVGIPHSQITSVSMNHTWNIILLDGDWYHVDCTWDDPTGGGQEHHRYFGLSDELMRQDHNWELPEYYPVANGTRYQYGVDNTPSATPTPAAQPTATSAPTATPSPTPAQPESAMGSFEYSIANGEVTITNYTGSETNVVVPATIEGLPVTVIGRYAFFYNGGHIATVSLPTSVHTIQDSAFQNCSNLTAVYGTKNVVAYGQWAFAGCTKLSYININTYNDLQEFGYACFQNCALPATVLGQPADSPLIDERTCYLYGEDITLCFFSVENGEAALVDAHWGGSNQKWHLNVPSTYRGMPVTAIAHNGVKDDWSIGGLTLPDSIRTIGENAFNNCIDLQATVYTGGIIVWRYAFGNSPGVTIKPETDPAYFDYTIRNGEVTINRYTGSKTTVVIPATIEGLPVTAIGAYAFAGCTDLNSITLTRDLSALSKGGDLQSSQRPTLCIPASVTSIGSYAFAGCSALQDVKLPDQLESIGDNAFSGIAEIDITLPANIQHIGESAFGGYPQTLPTMDCPTAFALAENQSVSDRRYKVAGLEEFLITAGKNAQGKKTFSLEDITATGHVEIPGGITAISGDVQQRINDGSITSLSIPDSVEKIDLHLGGTNQSFAIQCNPGSTASSWATENGVSWQSSPRCPGDADGNGRVNIHDALLVLQYSAGWDVTPYLLNADINTDGIVDLYDAVKILQSCSGTSFDSALRALLKKADELSIDIMTILEHPQDQHAVEGQQAVFKLEAAGENLQYQWYIDRGNGDGWRPIAGACSGTFTITAAQLTDNGSRYRCGITDASGQELLSDPATLHVTAAIELPQTGDQADLLLWAVLMALSIGGLTVLVFTGKRYSMTR